MILNRIALKITVFSFSAVSHFGALWRIRNVHLSENTHFFDSSSTQSRHYWAIRDRISSFYSEMEELIIARRFLKSIHIEISYTEITDMLIYDPKLYCMANCYIIYSPLFGIMHAFHLVLNYAHYNGWKLENLKKFFLLGIISLKDYFYLNLIIQPFLNLTP